MMTQSDNSGAKRSGKARRTRMSGQPAGRSRATKKARLIRMLSRKGGVEIAAISKNLGWLPHTTRAALTGLRKAGFELTYDKPGGGQPRRYRIVARPVD